MINGLQIPGGGESPVPEHPRKDERLTPEQQYNLRLFLATFQHSQGEYGLQEIIFQFFVGSFPELTFRSELILQDKMFHAIKSMVTNPRRHITVTGVTDELIKDQLESALSLHERMLKGDVPSLQHTAKTALAVIHYRDKKYSSFRQLGRELSYYEKYIVKEESTGFKELDAFYRWLYECDPQRERPS